MAHSKQLSKRKRPKTALQVWGAAGMSLAMTGGASAAVAPTTTGQHTPPPPSIITLGEEEIYDVSLATFYIFDKEDPETRSLGVQLARACRGGGRCGGGGRCAGAGGRCAAGGCAGRCAGGRCAAGRCAGGCGVGGCRCGVGCGVGVVACSGCSCSCCLSWGACRVDC